MSGPDHDAESSYANLVRELTGFPLIGMTLAGSDHTWSARHWNTGVGRSVAPTHCANVRVIGDQLSLSWNDNVCPPPATSERTTRTISCWGDTVQQDLARRRIAIVGVGSVGLAVLLHLVASGVEHVTCLDFDVVEPRNLDRLIGASRRDARLRRQKTWVARREAERAATADEANIATSNLSVCEPDGQKLVLDHDLIFCCVDRPWPRAILNSLAHTDLIPVIDGGLAVDTFDNGAMRNATWRSHVIRPGRPCLSCNGQLDLGRVALERSGLLDDPAYIATLPTASNAGQNVAPLSISAAASLLAQYVSLSVAPGGLGEPGPLQYALSTHHLEHRPDATHPNCVVEKALGSGDSRLDLTGEHTLAVCTRQAATDVSLSIRLGRRLDSYLARMGRR